MTPLRKLALVHCLALLSLNCSNAQEILTTPNLASQTAWQGCATYLPTRIWGGYSGGPCPNIGLNGTGINYSYGEVSLSQTFAINQALANAGSNLQVNGYNYSWQVKNSNINNTQPGGYDPIATITVNLTDKNRNTLVNDVYDYGYRLANWTTFSGTRTYNNPYALDSLGSISLSVKSLDSGYWAGYYGPEFQNFRLSLNYSVAQQVAPILPTPTTISTTTVNKTVTSIASSVDPTSSPVTNVNVGGVELSSSGTISAPDGIPQTVKDAVAVTSQDTTQNDKPTQSQESSVSAGAGQDKTESKPGAPMSLIMSAISKIQENDRATQRAAVQNAAQQLSLSVSKSQEQAMSVVSSLNSMSLASSQASIQSTLNVQSSQSSQAVNLAGTQTTTQTSSQSNSQSTQVLSFSLPQAKLPSQSYSVTANAGSIYSLSTPSFGQVQQQNYVPQNLNVQLELPSVSVNTISSRTNPLNELMENKTPLDNTRVETKTETVNRNVQSNELAGGVDIAMMAVQPKGYEAYSFVMKDASFYEPKEIYNKQNNVDNVRALRQLSSDRLHQEMVNQQYDRRN
jgi:epidermal growth factor receptor substrate 15